MNISKKVRAATGAAIMTALEPTAIAGKKVRKATKTVKRHYRANKTFIVDQQALRKRKKAVEVVDADQVPSDLTPA